jgi:hypothetical protein
MDDGHTDPRNRYVFVTRPLAKCIPQRGIERPHRGMYARQALCISHSIFHTVLRSQALFRSLPHELIVKYRQKSAGYQNISTCWHFLLAFPTTRYIISRISEYLDRHRRHLPAVAAFVNSVVRVHLGACGGVGVSRSSPQMTDR